MIGNVKFFVYSEAQLSWCLLHGMRGIGNDMIDFIVVFSGHYLTCL
jgi:hypothetical protein